MNSYELYTSRVSGSGIDTGYSDYERAQVYEQITGYEQVPMADIAQILSTHATRCSTPNMVIPEVNIAQPRELITAVCGQDMITASATVPSLQAHSKRTQCSDEDSPISLSAGVVPRIPDSYGKRKQNETINSVQWMVNKLKLGVAHPKLDSITEHGHVDHNLSAGTVLSINTHFSALDTKRTGELTSSYESSPRALFPLHSQLPASEIRNLQVSPFEQLSEYERNKYTILTGGLSSIYNSSPVEQFSGDHFTSHTGGLSSKYTAGESRLPVKQCSEYERFNYTSPAGRLSSNCKSPSGDQFSGYERVNYISPAGRLSSIYNSSLCDQSYGYERVNYNSPAQILSSNNSTSGDQFAGYERVNYTSPSAERLSSIYNSSSCDQSSGYERVNYNSPAGILSSNNTPHQLKNYQAFTTVHHVISFLGMRELTIHLTSWKIIQQQLLIVSQPAVSWYWI